MSSGSILATFPGANVLRQTPGTLRTLIASATAEDMDWQPAPDRWSINMVLAHLADVELKGFLDRFRAIVDQDDPFIPSHDQLDQFRRGTKFDGRAELKRFDERRVETLAWLESLPASVGSRTGRHEELGVLSCSQLLNEFAFHDLGHIRQVIELYRSHAFYPRMGVFQKYYQVHP